MTIHSISRRNLIAFVTAIILLCATAAFTQSRRERGPRALAVVDVLNNGKARLMPVAILIDGKFYDANFYRATPRPMAVDPEIIYDVLQEGKTIGTFTVGPVSNVGGIWVSEGKIKAPVPEKAPSEVNLGAGSKTASKRAADDEDKPPVLRRPDSKPSNTPPGNTPGNSAPHADNPPPASPKPAETPSSQSTKNDQDSDRPMLKRGKPEPAPESTPAKSTVASTEGKAETTTSAKKDKIDKQSAGQVKETYTAISDASTTEYRPYEYVESAQDKERFPRDLAGMALEALTRWSSTHSSSGVPVPGALQDVKIAAYDLDLNNTPTIVLTATKPATPRGAKGAAEPVPALQLYITVVARVDIYGNIRRLFTHVTDASHLDTIPRLELIDAVDADGTGRGQLLFRQIADMGQRSFILYRVGADQLFPLFEGAAHH